MHITIIGTESVGWVWVENLFGRNVTNFFTVNIGGNEDKNIGRHQGDAVGYGMQYLGVGIQ